NAQHTGPERDSRPQGVDAPTGDRRPEPRHRLLAIRDADGLCRHCGWRRWTHDRSPSRPGTRALGRRPIAEAPTLRDHDARTQEVRRGGGARAVRRSRSGPLPDWRRLPRRAPALEPGDTIAVIAPASAAKRTRILRGAQNLERLGFRVRVLPQAFARNG